MAYTGPLFLDNEWVVLVKPLALKRCDTSLSGPRYMHSFRLVGQRPTRPHLYHIPWLGALPPRGKPLAGLRVDVSAKGSSYN